MFKDVKLFPFVRRGVVASTRLNTEGRPILVLDLPSVPGFSGSPVIEIDSGRVIGVVRGPPKERREVDFSVAAVINKDDLEPARENPPNQPDSADAKARPLARPPLSRR